jgi:hypothetical protein
MQPELRIRFRWRKINYCFGNKLLHLAPYIMGQAFDCPPGLHSGFDCDQLGFPPRLANRFEEKYVDGLASILSLPSMVSVGLESPFVHHHRGPECLKTPDNLICCRELARLSLAVGLAVTVVRWPNFCGRGAHPGFQAL